MNQRQTPLRGRRAPAALAVLSVILVVAGCNTLAPGADPIVVRAEQGLAAADVIYKESMAYYFSPGVAATLSPSVVRIFETVRTGFDVPYKAVQGALDTYKALRTPAAAAAITEKQNALAAVMNPAVSVVPKTLKPVEVR